MATQSSPQTTSSPTSPSSDYQLVKEFTEQASGKPCPTTPQLMSKESVRFLTRMVMSELSELVNTVTANQQETEEFMADCLHQDPSKHSDDRSELNLIAEQVDALTDVYYYMLNSCCKHGQDLSTVFQVVHQANMAKKDPTTGKFIRRPSDGKILKPVGWQSPDIQAAVRQMGYPSNQN